MVGLVMVVAGGGTVLLGATSLMGVGSVTPNLDNEMRFYAVWYALAGIALLRAVSRIEREAGLVRAVGVAFFVAGCARAFSWAVVGRPHWFQVTLMTIELVLPFVIIPWQAAVARRADGA